jgi:NADH dehydrogenase
LGSFEQAKEIRSRVLNLFEKVKGTNTPVEILVGGGGFTGVELAGELAEWLPLLYEKYGISHPDKLFTVIEALSSLLSGWDAELCLEAQEFLENKGVRFVFDDPVLRVSDNNLVTKSGLVLEHDLFIWTGGVNYDPACGLGFEINSRRIVVDEYCRAKGYEYVFVAGDSACTVDSRGIPQSPTAHIAIDQGGVVVHNILSIIKGRQLRKYEFKRAGEIVTLGRSYAVGELFGLKFKGNLAIFMKKMINYWYLSTIMGVRFLFQK